MARAGLLIFDLDGTIFRTGPVTVAAARRSLAAFAVTPPEDDEITSFIGKPSEELYVLLRSLSRADQASQICETFDRLELELVPTIGAPFPGVLEALAELRGLAAHMAICTNGGRTYVDRVMGAHDLGHYFDAVRYRDATTDSKPSMVGELLQRFAGRPALVVGDRGDDVEAAHRNGIKAVAAVYGYGSSAELAQADEPAKSAWEIPKAVNLLLNGV